MTAGIGCQLCFHCCIAGFDSVKHIPPPLVSQKGPPCFLTEGRMINTKSGLAYVYYV